MARIVGDVDIESVETEPPETKAFVFTGGREATAKHFHGGRRVKIGQEVELTRDQAEAFRDRFRPADGVGFNEVDEDAAESGTDASKTSGKKPGDILTGTVNDVKETVGNIDDIATLRKMAAEEDNGKQRQGVLNAIAARIDELEQQK